MHNTKYINKKGKFSKRSFKRKRNRLIKISVFTLFFSTFFYFILFFTPLFKINRVQLSPPETHSFSPEVSKKILKKFFNSPIQNLNKHISKKTLLLYNKKRTQKKLKELYPEIDRVKIDWKFFNVWEISILKKKQFLYTCLEEECFSVDKNGIVYKKNNITKGIFLNHPQKSTEINTYVIDRKDFVYTSKILNYIINDLGIDVSSVSLSNEEKYLDIEIKLINGVFFYINNSKDIYPLTRAIYIAVNEIITKETEWVDITSIDFRFKDKIFFKEK